MKINQQHFNSLMINKQIKKKPKKNFSSDFSFRTEYINKSFSYSLSNKFDLNKINLEQNQDELIKNKLEKLSVFGKTLLKSNEKLITNNNFIDEKILNDKIKLITPIKNNNKTHKKHKKSFSTTCLKIPKKINIYKYNNINYKECKKKNIKSPNRYSNKSL